MERGGGIVPRRDYWSELHARLKKRGVLLVFDEVQTFGRTGHFFASQFFGVEPDMIALAKGISGIGVPGAAAVLLPSKFAILNSGERSLTWGSSVLTAAAIRATIRIMSSPEFFANVRESSSVLAERLLRLEHKYSCIGTIRGIGLMSGLEIVRSKESREPDSVLTNKIITCAMNRKLLLRNSLYGRGSFVKIRPPLIITPNQIDELCDRLDGAISDAIAMH